MKKINYINFLIVIMPLYTIVILFFLIRLFVFDNNSIRIKGDENVTLFVGSNYDDMGYSVFSLDGNDEFVSITSNLDTNVVGDYEIVYDFMGKEVVRKITVIDNVAPIISLVGGDSIYICKDKSYVELGYSATDNYDGDITNKVIVESDESAVIYTVTDNSQNTTSIKRNYQVGDVTPPEISFDDNIIVYSGNSFVDLYSAVDNCDGDITSNVEVSGSVDVNTVGVYKLIYTVTDSSGNSTSKEKTVNVKPAGDSTPTIYLTFDDGPSVDVTPKILDILKQYNIKATFFVISHATNTNDILKREALEGHTVGLHSYTHNYSMIYQNEDAFFDDLDKIGAAVSSIIGYRPIFIRFPGGSSNTVSKSYNIGIMTRLTKQVEEKGYSYFDWNVGSNDTSTSNPSTICSNVTNGLGSGTNIVLMHDYAGKVSNVEALPCIIKYALSHGYTFKAINSSTKQIHHGVNN